MEATPRTRDAVGCELFADVLSLGGSAEIRVTGSSMLPSVFPGDVLTVQRSGFSQVGVGDLVLFLRNGRIFAHRIITSYRGGVRKLITRGDALRKRDAPVGANELLGRVVSIRRRDSEISPRWTLSKRGTSILFQRSELLTRCLVWLLNRKRCQA